MQNNLNNQRMPEVVPVVSKCSRDYMSCLTNPYRSISPLPCIPDIISLPSNKFRSRSIGTFVTNASGQGGIGVNPFRTLSNSSAAYYASTSTWAPPVGDDFTFAAGTNTAAGFMSTSYNLVQLQQDFIQLRLVGCGVKVRYAGTELNRAGRITSYRSPSNTSIVSGTINQLLSIPSTRKFPMLRVWRSVTYVPDDPDFLGYQTVAELFAKQNFNQGTLLHIIDGAPPNTSFDYEISAYWEMIGAINFSNTNFTSSHSDPVGLGAAISAVPLKISERSPEQQEKKGIYDLGLEVLSTASHVVYKAGSAYLQSALLSYGNEEKKLIAGAGPTITEED